MLIKASTFSKDPAAWGLPHLAPVIKVDGPSVLCADERWRVDWTSSLGQWLYGQTPEFREHINRMLDEHGGLSATLAHRLEYQVAERLAALLSANVPGWAGRQVGVRFLKTGSGAVSAAIRLARAVTGRDVVVTFKGHYHGWHDQFIARVEPAWGVPDVFGYKVQDVVWGEMVDQPDGKGINGVIGYGVAAVVFEHPPEDPPDGWPEFLRGWCDRNGALLIADEVVTGLRNSPGGACGLWGYRPDLVCMGKALGNGAAVAALAGPTEAQVEGEIRPLIARFADNCPPFISTTTGGNILDLACADWVLANWDDKKVIELWVTGEQVIRVLRKAGLNIYGHLPRSVVRWDSEIERAYFIKAMADLGHLVNRPNFPNLAQDGADIDALGQAARDVKTEMDGMDPAEMYRKAAPLPQVFFRER